MARQFCFEIYWPLIFGQTNSFYYSLKFRTIMIFQFKVLVSQLSCENCPQCFKFLLLVWSYFPRPNIDSIIPGNHGKFTNGWPWVGTQVIMPFKISGIPGRYTFLTVTTSLAVIRLTIVPIGPRNKISITMEGPLICGIHIHDTKPEPMEIFLHN